MAGTNSGDLSFVRSRDGKVYYLIAADGSGTISVKFVEYYSSLAGLSRDERSGIFFVRDASRRRPGGDPTVKYGWAMYIYDFQNDKWVKIAEQESLDGGTDIESELLEKFVTKVDFNLHVQNFNNEVQARTQADAQFTNIINNELRVAIAALEKFHTDRADLWQNVLDKLSTQNSMLYFDGRPVTGSTYIYNKNNGSKLIWTDPTATTPTEEEVDNSKALADKFAQTALAQYGSSVVVVEVDGSLSTFTFIKSGDNKLAVFDHTNMSSTIGVARLENLPTPTTQLVGRGLFSPIKTTGGLAADHVYECKLVDGNPTWVDLTESGASYGVAGAKITVCYTDDNLSTLWKTSKIFWDDPTDEFWAATVLVRKQGSAPTNVNDGQIIGTFKAHEGVAGVTDTVPFSESNIYYNVFAKTKSGLYYQPVAGNLTAGKPELLGWDALKSMIANNLFRKVFAVNDYIILPPHSLLGEIKCKITAINDTSVIAVTEDVLVKMPFKANATDSVAYADSDVCAWINTTFKSGFGTEQSRIVSAIIPDDASTAKYYEKEGTPTPYWADSSIVVPAVEAVTTKGVAVKVTL